MAIPFDVCNCSKFPLWEQVVLENRVDLYLPQRYMGPELIGDLPSAQTTAVNLSGLTYASQNKLHAMHTELK
jgi:hypothetical protein